MVAVWLAVDVAASRVEVGVGVSLLVRVGWSLPVGMGVESLAGEA
jgi:hypothetical protein